MILKGNIKVLGYKSKKFTAKNGQEIDFIEMTFCDDVHAELLNQAFNKRMEAKLEQIRREAYNQGWKDKSAHRKKETWFSKWWKN